jgi:hypothetical protein
MKVDGWLVALVGVSFVGMLATSVALCLTPVTFLAGIATLVTTLALAALIAAISVPARFEVSSEALVASGGKLLRVSVPLASIRRVYRTMNPLSSPFAWSLDRVMVRHDGGMLLLATTDPEGLITAIADASGCHSHQDDGSIYRSV